jgi:hypothetical protein
VSGDQRNDGDRPGGGGADRGRERGPAQLRWLDESIALPRVAIPEYWTGILIRQEYN